MVNGGQSEHVIKINVVMRLSKAKVMQYHKKRMQTFYKKQNT